MIYNLLNSCNGVHCLIEMLPAQLVPLFGMIDRNWEAAIVWFNYINSHLILDFINGSGKILTKYQDL